MLRASNSSWRRAPTVAVTLLAAAALGWAAPALFEPRQAQAEMLAVRFEPASRAWSSARSSEPLPNSEVKALPAPKPLAASSKSFASRALPRVGEKPNLIATAWRAQHERQLRLSNRASTPLIFLGDSITEGWGVAPAYREHFRKYSPLNLGIAGDTTQNVLWRVQHGALDGTSPKVVVLMIGVNNLAGGFSAEDTADGVRAIVAAVEARVPAARVLLLSVLPIGQRPTNPVRTRIEQANLLLEGLAEPERVEVHDLSRLLLEPDGTITKSTLRDFVHPTASGFERLTRALEPLLEPLLAPPATPSQAQPESRAATRSADATAASMPAPWNAEPARCTGSSASAASAPATRAW